MRGQEEFNQRSRAVMRSIRGEQAANEREVWGAAPPGNDILNSDPLKSRKKGIIE